MGNVRKINVTMDSELLDRIDDFAKSRYLSRSGFLALASSQYLDAVDLQRSLGSVASILEKYQDTGSLSPEDSEKLAAFQAASSALLPDKK